jgi:hypothetical protein
MRVLSPSKWVMVRKPSQLKSSVLTFGIQPIGSEDLVLLEIKLSVKRTSKTCAILCHACYVATLAGLSNFPRWVMQGFFLEVCDCHL